MRINIYAEEQTDRVEIVEKNINGQVFTGVRFYLYLPVTVRKDAYMKDGEYFDGPIEQVQGPFIHGENDDDSSAITFWGKTDLRKVLKKALDMLDTFYVDRANKIMDEHNIVRKFVNGQEVK